MRYGKVFGETYITPWWIRGNLSLMKNKIQLWNEVNINHMLIGRDEEIWCSWNENGNW